ncbi:glutathione S-transferase [Dactylonectria macrodidyma]|uniref:Glutathione S-transferase n=1 Tax=Dactylonectria macrodidyma TaxID=307937 RepID=A0A9P9I996_9HYPO|nr:glutathione S-transferase [Dactylonectria macrodidyma]
MAPLGTLHAVPFNPRVKKILATAALAGIELTVPSEFKFGVTNKSSEFLVKFPLGKVPALETATGFHLVESNAIAYYVAESAPNPVRDQLLGVTPEERALVQQWIFFTQLHLDPTVGKLGAWRKGFAQYDAKEEETNGAEMKRWLDYMESSLKGKRWFLGDTNGPSLADITIGGSMYFAYFTYVDGEMRKEYPELLRWYEQLKAEPKLSTAYAGEMVLKRVEPGMAKE